MSEISRLAARLARLEEKQLARSTEQLAMSSIEDGAIEVNDADGNLVAIIGTQEDGSHILKPLDGPTPAVPAGLAVTTQPGVVTASWDGSFELSAPITDDHHVVEVHASSTSGFAPGPGSLKGNISGRSGGSVALDLAPGTYYFVLVARTLAGKASAPSAEVPVTVVAPADAAAIGQQLNDRITVATTAPVGNGTTNGDVWFQVFDEVSFRVIGMWTWTGSAWVQHEVGSTVLAADQIWADTAWLTSFEGSTAKFTSVDGTRMLTIDKNGLVVTDALADGSTEELVKISAAEIERLTIKNTANDLGDVSINNAGGVSAASGSFGSILVDGTDPMAELARIPKMVARNQRTSSTGVNPSTSSVHNQPVMRLEFTAEAGKLYMVKASNCRATSAGTATRARWRMAATTDGTLATTSATVRQEAISGPRPSAASDLPSVDLTWMLPNSTTRTVSVLIYYSAYGGVDNVTLDAWADSPLSLEVYEYPTLGTSGYAGYVGTVSSGGTEETPTAAPKQKTQTWLATGCNSWRNGAAYGGGTWMYQGYTPYDSGGGIKTSHCVFGAGSLGQSIPTAMASATEIVKLEVYLYFEHWYASAGGTANLYRHSSTAVGSYPGGTFLKSVTWNRNQGKWVEITNSTDVAAFLAGNFQGITLSTGSTSSEYYGYARGTGSLRPKIRCTYMTTA